MKILPRFWVPFLLAFLVGSFTEASLLRHFPVTVTQPDGTVLQCYLTGDEFFHYATDAEGYPVLRDPNTGEYVYGRLAEDGSLIPTRLRAGRDDPAQEGLLPGVVPRPGKAAEAEARLLKSSSGSGENHLTPTKGTIQNVVIFIRFSDEAEFSASVSYMTGLFDKGETSGRSLRDFYRTVSYSQLDIQTSIFPTPTSSLISYQDSHPRRYFQPYSSTNPDGYPDSETRQIREHTLLRDAVNSVSPQIPSSLAVDGDGDGVVDSITFVVKGQPDGWSTLLWPHAWTTSITTRINGKLVYKYNLQLETALAQSELSGVSVLAHEMFHVLGAPDLYHYTENGISPTSIWDLMASDAAQHPSAYMKYRYGKWISEIPRITASGWYTLSPLSASSNNCFRVNSPFSDKEYFILEYRKKDGYDAVLPGSGLLVTRIDTTRNGAGNRNGPPDEVFMMRPYGTPHFEGLLLNAALSASSSSPMVSEGTAVSPFLSSGGTGGLDIPVIGTADDTLTFYVRIPECMPPGISVQPTSQSIESGSTATLSVTAAGTGTFSYQWYEGKRGDRSHPTSGNQASFTTPGLVSTHRYWVEVSNSCGSVMSQEAFVDVALPNLPGGGRYRAAGAVVGNRLYVMGGGDGSNPVLGRLECLDGATGQWNTSLASMPVALRNVQAAAIGNVIYVPGGYTGSQLSQTLQAYNVDTNTWQSLALPPAGLSSTVAACRGKLYCFGGDRTGSSSTTATVWCYDPGANAWNTSLAPMPQPMGYGCAVAVNRFCYVVGGNSSNDYSMPLYRYDTVANVWESGPSLNIGRMSPAVAWLGEYLYVVEGGGALPGVWWPTNVVERYNLSSWPNGNWEVILGRDLPTGVVAAAYGVLSDGRLFLAGGAMDSNRQTTSGLQTFAEPGLSASSFVTVTPESVAQHAADNLKLSSGDAGADINGDGQVNALDIMELKLEASR